MTQDVDYIIDLLKNLTTSGKKSGKDELGEQDAAAGGGGGG